MAIQKKTMQLLEQVQMIDCWFIAVAYLCKK